MSSASTLLMFCCKMPPEMGPSLRVCSHQKHKMITVQSIKNNINHIQVDTTFRSVPSLKMLQHRSQSQSSISFWLDSWIFSRLMHNIEKVPNMFFFISERTDQHDIKQHRETRQSDRFVKYLFHTHVIDSNLGLSWGLHEGAVAELPGEVESLVLAHHPLILEVALVPHQHHGHIVTVLDPENLLPEILEDTKWGNSIKKVQRAREVNCWKV